MFVHLEGLTVPNAARCLRRPRGVGFRIQTGSDASERPARGVSMKNAFAAYLWLAFWASWTGAQEPRNESPPSNPAPAEVAPPPPQQSAAPPAAVSAQPPQSPAPTVADSPQQPGSPPVAVPVPPQQSPTPPGAV